MRMPILSYFVVVGSVLAGLLIWTGQQAQPTNAAVKTSQTVGLPQPFKAPPEQSELKVTGVNFAAQRESSVTKTVKTAETPRKQKVTVKHPATSTWRWVAEFPHDRLNIH